MTADQFTPEHRQEIRHRLSLGVIQPQDMEGALRQIESLEHDLARCYIESGDDPTGATEHELAGHAIDSVIRWREVRERLRNQKQAMLAAWDEENERRHDVEEKLAAAEGEIQRLKAALAEQIKAEDAIVLRTRAEYDDALAEHCACTHDGRGELTSECQEHQEQRESKEQAESRLAAVRERLPELRAEIVRHDADHPCGVHVQRDLGCRFCQYDWLAEIEALCAGQELAADHSLRAERDLLLAALLGLRHDGEPSDPPEDACFCLVATRHPMATTHSPACLQARAALNRSTLEPATDRHRQE